MKVLIIGGTGVLSTAVVNCCISHGFDVTIMHRGYRKQFANSLALQIICDITDEKRVVTKIKDLYFDVVIDFLILNENCLMRSLSLFGKITKQYFYISTAQVYNTSIPKIFSEDDETPQSLWEYSIKKDECEKYLRDYGKQHGLIYTIVRPGVTYDNRRIPYGIVPPYGMHWTIVARVLAGKPIITWNQGQNKLNLTRVEDFAEGIVGLLGNEKAYNESFNVVGDSIYSWNDVLQTIGKILNVKVKTVDFPVEAYSRELSSDNRERLLGGRSNNLVLSNKKLKSVVPGFRSIYPLEEGLKMTVEGYRANNYYDGIDYKWDAEQDRIIRKLTKTYRGRFVVYSPQSLIERMIYLCTWKIEYYSDKQIMRCFWKMVRKFVIKPMKFLSNRT